MCYYQFRIVVSDDVLLAVHHSNGVSLFILNQQSSRVQLWRCSAMSTLQRMANSLICGCSWLKCQVQTHLLFFKTDPQAVLSPLRLLPTVQRLLCPTTANIPQTGQMAIPILKITFVATCLAALHFMTSLNFF